MKYSSNFDGLLIKAKIKGKYEVWQESFTTEELGLEEEQDNMVSYILIVMIVIILVVVAFFILRSR
jgi:hypothetical protein